MPRKPISKQAADVLADAGRALYGESWRMPLSEATDIHPDTIRKFMSGRVAVPAGGLDKGSTLVGRRIDGLEALAGKNAMEPAKGGSKPRSTSLALSPQSPRPALP